ncbi:MAG: MBL fold metallo-hydrolase [Gemmatimonadota bacterium]
MGRGLASSLLLLAALACGAPGDPAPGAGSGRARGGPARPAVEVTFLDVGQGDATLIRTSEGRTALIDAGPGDPTAQLRDLGVERLDLVIATHPHADHIGGMEAVLAAFPVGSYMDSGKPHSTETYLGLLRALRDRPDIPYLEAVPRSLTLGSATLEVLPLPPANQVDHNDRSVGVVVRFGQFAAFLSGDSERPLLSHFLDHDVVPDVTLLKAAHHGSRDGFTDDFLNTARPEVVVISLGANGYGHPHRESLAAYAAVAREVYRTDVVGTVTIVGYQDGSYMVGKSR